MSGEKQPMTAVRDREQLDLLGAVRSRIVDVQTSLQEEGCRHLPAMLREVLENLDYVSHAIRSHYDEEVPK